MTALPEIVGRDEFAALIIRIDYDDDAARQAVVAEVTEPWGMDGESEVRVHLVDDPAWAGATPEAVLNVVKRDENLCVVFIADRVTMQSAHCALHTLNVPTEDEDLNPMYYQALIDSPPARKVPHYSGRGP